MIWKMRHYSQEENTGSYEIGVVLSLILMKMHVHSLQIHYNERISLQMHALTNLVCCSQDREISGLGT